MTRSSEWRGQRIFFSNDDTKNNIRKKCRWDITLPHFEESVDVVAELVLVLVVRDER